MCVVDRLESLQPTLGEMTHGNEDSDEHRESHRESHRDSHRESGAQHMELDEEHFDAEGMTHRPTERYTELL